jgi:putative ABC transport system permease protein
MGSIGPIVLASVRDLQWRTRRFLLAAVATGLVFGLALMMSGVSNSFAVEVRNTVSAVGASGWLVPSGSPGPFTDPKPFVLHGVPNVSGVTAIEPIFVGRALAGAPKGSASSGSSSTSTTTSGASTTAPNPASEKGVNLLGVVPGALGSPKVVSGKPLQDGADIVADKSLGAKIGQTLTLNGVSFTVVGLLSGVTYFAGQPVAFMPLTELQAIDADGLDVATGFIVKGTPSQAVAGFTLLTNAQVQQDLSRPVSQAKKTITLIEFLLWLVAAGIVGAIIYLSALERRSDFAVLKAVGTPGWHLFIGLVIQAVLMALGAAVIGFGVELLIAPTSAMAVRLSASDYAAVPIVAVGVGILASILPARRAATVDPALAFGGGK